MGNFSDFSDFSGRLVHRQRGLVGLAESIQRVDQRALLHRRADYRQLVERLEAEIVKKLPRCGEQRRPADSFAMPDHLDPVAVFELLEDQGVDGNAANVFHVAARDWLTVGNDGQRFEHGARVPRRLLRVQPVKVVAHVGPALKTPAGADAHEFQAALRPVFLQFDEQRLDGVGTEFIAEQHAKVAHRQRLSRTDQGGFENALGIRRIHGSRYPGKGA